MTFYYYHSQFPNISNIVKPINNIWYANNKKSIIYVSERNEPERASSITSLLGVGFSRFSKCVLLSELTNTDLYIDETKQISHKVLVQVCWFGKQLESLSSLVSRITSFPPPCPESRRGAEHWYTDSCSAQSGMSAAMNGQFVLAVSTYVLQYSYYYVLRLHLGILSILYQIQHENYEANTSLRRSIVTNNEFNFWVNSQVLSVGIQIGIQIDTRGDDPKYYIETSRIRKPSEEVLNHIKQSVLRDLLLWVWVLFSTDLSLYEGLLVCRVRPTCHQGPKDGSMGKLSCFLSADGRPLAIRILLHIKHTIKLYISQIQRNIKGNNELLTLLLPLRKLSLQTTFSMFVLPLACQLLDVVYPGINSWVQAFKLK